MITDGSWEGGSKIGVVENLKAKDPSNQEIRKTTGVNNRGKRISQGEIILLLVLDMNEDMLKSVSSITKYVTRASNLTILLDSTQP